MQRAAGIGALVIAGVVLIGAGAWWLSSHREGPTVFLSAPVKRGDVSQVISVILTFWFWFTPIVYIFDILPPLAQQILFWNPMAAVVSGYHDIFVYQRVPSFFYLSLVLAASIVLILLDYLIFRKLEKDIRDFI